MDGKTRYEKYMKVPEDSHQERLDKIRNDKAYYAFTEERHEAMKDFYEKYGRSWPIFVGVTYQTDTWIEQYRIIQAYNREGDE